ncbi:MAG: lipoyl synthase [Flavobacteriaceae bacterium]
MALVHKIQDKTQIPKPHWKSLNISNRNSYISKENFVKKPKWIRVKLPTGKKYTELRGLVDKYKLNTICSSGSCPNMGECWGEGTATFMILGNICTRSCGFCGVKTGKPENVDWSEPEKVANSIKIMKVKHAVITSVDRDDLKDMGTFIWTETVRAIRRLNPEITLETLIPDFQGIEKHLDKIIEVKPEVVSHNMETVKRLTREVRIQAKYERSLSVLKYLKKSGIRRTKSGIMLGLGEKENEVFQTLIDLKENDVDIVTLGQYLQPSKKHLPLKNYIEPKQFKVFESFAKDLGFRHVESSALVRSSYKAQKHIL